MNQFEKKHMDLLQNIEFTLVTAYRNDNTIDDAVIRNALRELVYNKTCEDPRSELIVSQLHEIKNVRSDISDKIWKQTLRIGYNYNLRILKG